MKWTLEHNYWLPLVRSDQGDILVSALVDKRHDGKFGWVVSSKNERLGASGNGRCLVTAMRAATEAANAVAKELGFTALCHAWQCCMELKAESKEQLGRVTLSSEQYRYFVMRRSDLYYVSSGYCATLPEALQQAETFMATARAVRRKELRSGLGAHLRTSFLSMRVLAISQAKDGVVHSYGEGTMTEGQHPIVGTNPRIVLDNGGVVWGCECWWGAPEKVRERFSPAKGWRWEEIAAPHQEDGQKS